MVEGGRREQGRVERGRGGYRWEWVKGSPRGSWLIGNGEVDELEGGSSSFIFIIDYRR